VTHVGIDEIHMFKPGDMAVIERLLLNGVEVVISGLDMDYRGELFEAVKRLLELGPKEVRYKRAVCYNCRKLDAVYTQIFHDGVPMAHGLLAVMPDDGSYEYRPACRHCFAREPRPIDEVVK
jgi:thymidine kinase